MNEVFLTFHEYNGELKITIDSDSLIISGFKVNLYRNYETILPVEGQEKLIKRLVANMTLRKGGE